MEKRMSGTSKFAKADRIVYLITKYFSYIAVACILVMGIMSTADVVAAKVFGQGIPITNDLIKFLMVPTCFCFLANVQVSHGIMQVDLFCRKYKGGFKKAFYTFVCVLGAAIFGFASWRCWLLMQKYIINREQSSMSAYAFPLWPFAAICALGLTLLVFSFIWVALRMYMMPEGKAAAEATPALEHTGINNQEKGV